MLKKLFLFSIFAFNLSLGIATAAKLPASSSIETLQGTVQPLGFFEKMRTKWIDNVDLSYALIQNGKRTTFLTYRKNDVRTKRKLEQCVGRSVRIKGTREFVAVDPYFLVTVEDVCMQ